MSTAVAGYLRPIPLPKPDVLRRDPAAQALLLLRITFTVAPILFGLDKFANVLTDWTHYLAPVIDRIVPGTATQAMWAVGVVEANAGAVRLYERAGFRPYYRNLLGRVDDDVSGR